MTDFNEKQVEILLVAEKLFSDKGFDGASIRDIAKEAGVNVAMISYYFGSKEKLLDALILYRTSSLRLQMESMMMENLSPLERMDRMTEMYMERINANRKVYQIVHFELSTKKRLINTKAFTDVKKKNLESLTHIIRAGQEQGIFREDINIPLIPPTILGTFFHFQMNRPFFEDVLELDTDEKYEAYIKNQLTDHIKRTIKALLLK